MPRRGCGVASGSSSSIPWSPPPPPSRTAWSPPTARAWRRCGSLPTPPWAPRPAAAASLAYVNTDANTDANTNSTGTNPDANSTGANPDIHPDIHPEALQADLPINRHTFFQASLMTALLDGIYDGE